MTTTRVGLGFDAHRFDEGSPLVLGGVPMEGPGLAGHSDADVLSHAIADSLLGAAGQGDLGEHFPAIERWAKASSIDILLEVVARLEKEGWSVDNIDATLIAETPKLGPHRDAMSERLAAAIGIPTERVSVKATTTDGMGFTGRGEGIAALAVAQIRRSNDE